MSILLSMLAANKGHAAAYIIILAMGVAGYTNLLLELGELRATDQYQVTIINHLQDTLINCKGN